MLFITHLLGFCDDLDKIKSICKSKGIILIEDACEALGTIYKGKKLGNFGLASTFSFFVGHHLSTIEGGAVCTDDAALASMLRMVRSHGWDRNLESTKQDKIRKLHRVPPFHALYTFYDLAYNLRPTEINGFIGNNQLKYIDRITGKRNRNFMKIAPAIYKQSERYMPIKYDHIAFLSNFAVPLLCRTEKIRDQLIERCRDKVEIRPIVGGDITQQPFFKKYLPDFDIMATHSNASLVHRQGLYFGNNPDMTTEELNYILATLTASS